MLKRLTKHPHVRDAYIYANHVTKGHRPACEWERLSCQRFLDDLKKGKEFAFDLDVDKAEKACRFIENLPHTRGRWAAKKELIKLEPWQCFIVVNLFGWVDAKGLRRFRDAYLKIPRKNGKSLLAAAIGLYMFCADGEFGAEVYSGATTEKQAWETFRPARLMCTKTDDLRDHFGIEANAKNLHILDNGSKFEPLIGDPGDGASPSCAIVDEYHEHDSDALVETMETGMGAREQPLLLKATTAGNNLGGPCYLAELEYRKILGGVFEDERIFVIMFGVDEGDDWTDPKILEKANPNFDVSVSGEFLIAQQKVAIRNASKQNAFRRKHLNEWTGAHTAWLNINDWNKCADESLSIDDFKGEHCAFILDLASRIDLTAFAQLFKREIQGKDHWYAFLRFYLPEETVHEKENYETWSTAGFITATEGDEIDFNEIQAEVEEMLPDFDADVVYDPWRATQLAQGLKGDGATTIEYRNTVPQMSPPMYELEAAITAGRFHHDGNPVLTWMASNVVAKIDAKDNIYPRKETPGQTIDGMVAFIMGIGYLMHHEPGVAPSISFL